MSLKLSCVVAALTLLLVGCNQSGGGGKTVAAEACTKFGAISFPDGAGISTTRSQDGKTLSLIFDSLRANTTDGQGDTEDDASLSLALEPEGCTTTVDVSIRGFCLARDMSKGRPELKIKWSGETWSGSPECASDGAGYLMTTSIDASSAKEASFNASATLGEGSNGQLTIDSIDLMLPK